ncbi:hypothetical protein N7463_008530 [Penicillium fimorum]|uniref:Uncharacterized protein n=1 Tax=Penicillium fimorum TaxID=1882269 RepID=A0A9W9XP50_9EURO|nr:hypothetical protein N7463_008530 [Penicillium fimorum]
MYQPIDRQSQLSDEQAFLRSSGEVCWVVGDVERSTPWPYDSWAVRHRNPDPLDRDGARPIKNIYASS